MFRFTLLSALLLAGCEERGPGAPPPSAAFSDRAIATLDSLQPASIEANREVCGYFGHDAEGVFVATEPRLGGEDHCDLPRRPPGVAVIASYHTHSAYGEDHDSEVPSSDDVLADMEDRTFGYVSTPGGRVWLIDWRTGDARQLCGIGCVRADSAFVPGDAGLIAPIYSLNALIGREL